MLVLNNNAQKLKIALQKPVKRLSEAHSRPNIWNSTNYIFTVHIASVTLPRRLQFLQKLLLWFQLKPNLQASAKNTPIKNVVALISQFFVLGKEIKNSELPSFFKLWRNDLKGCSHEYWSEFVTVNEGDLVS